MLQVSAQRLRCLQLANFQVGVTHERLSFADFGGVRVSLLTHLRLDHLPTGRKGLKANRNFRMPVSSPN